MGSVIDESIAMSDDIGVDASSYTWAVDNAIRSDTASYWGATSAHSFASVVNRAIRSDTASNFEASPRHGFASAQNVWSIISARSSKLEVTPNASPRHVAAPLLTLAKLKEATNNFSLDSIIGDGSFGVVYRGKLVDGRKVAIKRAETWSNRPRPIFNSELTFLTRLHHKHLVGLVGFCEEKDERLLVYEYMKNGSLHHHLHEKRSSLLNSWKMRINIALDASLGIQYLHNIYEGRSVIHRNVKSCNILLDDTWTARVSDFGLTFIDNTAGTDGYTDPEYSREKMLTAKSDVYGLGVVLLELLTGKKPMFKSVEDERSSSLSVVNFAVPAILSRKLVEILDPNVGPPDVNEVQALELVANTAIHCLKLEREDRPIMPNVVVNLKQALAICDWGNRHFLSRFGGVWLEKRREILRKIKGRERKQYIGNIMLQP